MSDATKKARTAIFKGVIAKAGAQPYAAITKRSILASIEGGAPFAAVNFLKAVRGLFKWAVETGLLAADPTDGIKPVTPPSDGFRPWTDSDIERFKARWPVGSRERLALTVLLCTGLRRGDAVRLGPAHVVNGVIEIRTQKTGQLVVIPIAPELTEVIAATPIGSSTFIARLDGKPRDKAGFGNDFRDACNAAGVLGSAHGIRKLGAAMAANGGASERELNAFFGWGDGSRESATYTRSADRTRLARQAMDKMTKRE
ncbi:tyrosine-type recombinase/integrase [Methylocella sp.]|uniref:tyrosine-type recombinase/integrase n=1 Tax=Methylocella sp. TaxID=1978226 RepID=UPI003C257413